MQEDKAMPARVAETAEAAKKVLKPFFNQDPKT